MMADKEIKIEEYRKVFNGLLAEGKLSLNNHGHMGNGIYKLPGGGYCGKAAYEMFEKKLQELGKQINTE